MMKLRKIWLVVVVASITLISLVTYEYLATASLQDTAEESQSCERLNNPNLPSNNHFAHYNNDPGNKFRDQHQQQHNFHLILMQRRRWQTLSFPPGTDHWFHLLESLIGNLPSARRHIWPLINKLADNKLRSHSTQSTYHTHHTAYIAFQEPESATKLSSFCCLALAAVLTGGFVGTVHFGYIPGGSRAQKLTGALWEQLNQSTSSPMQTSTSYNISDLVIHVSFVTTRTLELTAGSSGFIYTVVQPSTSLRYGQGRQRTIAMCFLRPNAHAAMFRPTSETFDWFADQRPPLSFEQHLRHSDYQAFRDSISRLCGMAAPPYAETLAAYESGLQSDRSRNDTWYMGEPNNVSLARLPSPVSAPDDYLYMRSSLRQRQSVQIGADTNTRLYASRVPARLRRLVIYQRDSSRKLLNANWAREVLIYMFGTRSASLPGAAQWKVDILYHSNSRHACELVGEMNTATLLLTSHGFQSVLLLLQPHASLLAEVHPSGYLQQGFYGEMQAALRVRLGLSRAYLAEESAPDTQCWYGMIALFHRLFHEQVCASTGSGGDRRPLRTLCRYLYRLQSVTVSQDMLQRIVDVAMQYYVS